jgi:hypothetical protein
MLHRNRETALLFEKPFDWSVWYLGRSWNPRLERGMYERFALQLNEK